MMLPRLTVTNIATCIFVLYMSHSIYTIYQLFTPRQCIGDSKACLVPAFREKDSELPALQIRVHISSQKTHSKSAKEAALIRKDLDLTKDFEQIVQIKIPPSTRNNGTLFAHVYLLPSNFDGEPSLATWSLEAHHSICTYIVPMAETFQLMGGSENVTQSNKPKETTTDLKTSKPFTHIRAILPLEGVTDYHSFHWNEVPGEIHHLFKLNPEKKYLPLFLVNEIGFRVKDLVHAKSDLETMNLTIAYRSCSIGKLRLTQTALRSLDQLKNLGFSEKDCDEVKSIFVDTNFYFLALTFSVAAVHILLDFLAFKNDISFWRGRKTTVGLSTRTLLWRCFSQSIIFLYLLDEETSLLVLIPAGIGTLIELWKVKKAYKINISIIGGLPRFQMGTSSAEEIETKGFDAEGMKYVALLLAPLCLGGAVYSLIYTPHKSWYSWLIQSMANGVYAFGFIFMLPQLFVNYKLKSVAHLPWRAFTYKAFNTFIDDLFAFIIYMPTAHRLACFRDDIVFVVYLYQRYLYPVDKKRVNEFGESFEEEGKKEK